MKKTTGLVAVITAAVMLFCSCSPKWLAKSDTLIEPPKFFSDQKNIIKALKASVGNDIVLAYPGTGDYRSAFILYDLDGDLADEVIVFYKPAGSLKQDIVHINLLDSQDGKWVSLCDIIGEASKIDKVSIGKTQTGSELLVGWNVITDFEKKLVCYSYGDRMLTRDYSTSYVEFALADFSQRHEGDEIITLNYSQGVDNLTSPKSHARLIEKTDGEFKITSTVPLDSRVQGYKNCFVGKYNQSNNAFFIDGLVGTNVMTTQILAVSTNGKLSNPLLKGTQTDKENIRSGTLLSQDIDSDGIVEVPSQIEFPGYEQKPDSEKIYETIWHRFYGGELKEYKSIYMGNNIRMMIPLSIDGKTTVKYKASSNELEFYEFEKSVEKSEHKLFSIRVSDTSFFADQNEYIIIKQNEYTVVSARIFDASSELCLKIDELKRYIEIV